MHALFRSPLLRGAALLIVGAPFALAQSPLPDPVAPAVIGRPLDQLKPVRPKAVTAKRAAARPVAAAAVAAPTAPQAAPVAAAPEAPVAERAAKQAVDDRADPRMRMDDVGKGTHLARKPLGEGAYFADRHRIAAQKYYEQHPIMRPAVKWKIGEPVPGDAVVAAVPRGLLAALPQLPPGHQYVELGGEVVLVAVPSKMVVDGISRGRGETALVSR